MAVQELYVLVAMVVILFVLTVVNGLLYLRANSRARYGDRMLYLAVEEGKAALARGGPSGMSKASLRAVHFLTQLRFAKKWMIYWWAQFQMSRCYYTWFGRATARMARGGPAAMYFPKTDRGSMEPAPQLVSSFSTSAPYGTPNGGRAVTNPLVSNFQQNASADKLSSRFRYVEEQAPKTPEVVTYGASPVSQRFTFDGGNAPYTPATYDSRYGR